MRAVSGHLQILTDPDPNNARIHAPFTISFDMYVVPKSRATNVFTYARERKASPRFHSVVICLEDNPRQRVEQENIEIYLLKPEGQQSELRIQILSSYNIKRMAMWSYPSDSLLSFLKGLEEATTITYCTSM